MVHVCVWIILTCSFRLASSQNVTVAAYDIMTDLSKAFISAGVLAVALLLSLLIAKIVDHCYDRASIRDDASDISEHTRNLIRARLAVRNFRSPSKKKTEASEADKELKQKKLLRMWSAKAHAKSGSYPKEPDLGGMEEGGASKTKELILGVAEAAGKSGGKEKDKPASKVTIINESGSPKKGGKVSKTEKQKQEPVTDKTAKKTIPKAGQGNGELPGTPLSSKRDSERGKAGSPSRRSPTRNVSPTSRPRTAPSSGTGKGNVSKEKIKAKDTENVKRSVSQKVISFPGSAKRVDTVTPSSAAVSKTGKLASNVIAPAASTSAVKSTPGNTSPTNGKSGSVSARAPPASVSKPRQTSAKAASSTPEPVADNVSKGKQPSGKAGSNSAVPSTEGTGAPVKHIQVGRVSPTKPESKAQISVHSAASSDPSKIPPSILISPNDETEKDEAHHKKNVQFQADPKDEKDTVSKEDKAKV